MQVQADGAHTRTFEALDGNYEVAIMPWNC